MSRKIIIIVVAIVAVVAVVALAITLFLAIFGPAVSNVYDNILEDASTTGEDFLQALKAADYETAYALLHPDVQSEISGPESLEANFPPSVIDTWEYEATSITTTDGVGGIALTGILTLSDGSQYDMQLILVKVGEENRLAGYSFQPR